jgi:hypothetical protein
MDDFHPIVIILYAMFLNVLFFHTLARITGNSFSVSIWYGIANCAGNTSLILARIYAGLRRGRDRAVDEPPDHIARDRTIRVDITQPAEHGGRARIGNYPRKSVQIIP